MSILKTSLLKISPVLAMLLFVGVVAAQSDDKQKPISLAGGKFQMTGPAGWKQKTPRVNIIEAEFAVPKVEGDSVDGRLTVMASGGGVKANVDRWEGQFSKTEKSSVKKEKVGDFEVHIVDISGTFKDQRGPFAPATMRPGYRMMGAIIVMDKGPDYFAKFYGPEKTVGENAKKFMAFVKSFSKK